MRIKLFIYLFLAFVCRIGMAQQSPLYSQYILNEFIINPATAGNDGMTAITLNGRKQWLGWKFAPENYSASISGRILKSPQSFVAKRSGARSQKKGPSGRVGLGGSVIVDRNGAMNKTSVSFTYAYHLPFHNSQLSMGLTFLANQFRIDDEFAEVVDPGDPLNGLIGSSTFSPDAGLGIDFSATKFHAGLAAYNLFQSPVKFGAESIDYRELRLERHYYFLGTYKDKFQSKPEWQYEPSLVARGTERFNGMIEASVRFIYMNEYWFGFSGRTTKDIIFLMGLKVDMFYFGYSFDYGFNDIAKLSYGSHEVVVAIKLGDNTRRYRYWERY